MKKKPAKSKPAPAKPQEIFWTVMKMRKWDSLTVLGIPVGIPKGGPCGFIPVFDTREQAVVWDDGSGKYVRMLTTNF